jgi:hypothetical protein
VDAVANGIRRDAHFEQLLRGGARGLVLAGRRRADLSSLRVFVLMLTLLMLWVSSLRV